MIDRPDTPGAIAGRLNDRSTQLSDGTHVLAMSESEINSFVHRTAELNAIDVAFGYPERPHITPAERTAIETRAYLKTLKGNSLA